MPLSSSGFTTSLGGLSQFRFVISPQPLATAASFSAVPYRTKLFLMYLKQQYAAVCELAGLDPREGDRSVGNPLHHIAGSPLVKRKDTALRTGRLLCEPQAVGPQSQPKDEKSDVALNLIESRSALAAPSAIPSRRRVRVQHKTLYWDSSTESWHRRASRKGAEDDLLHFRAISGETSKNPVPVCRDGAMNQELTMRILGPTSIVCRLVSIA